MTKIHITIVVAALLAIFGICATVAYVMHDKEVTKRVCITKTADSHCIPSYSG